MLAVDGAAQFMPQAGDNQANQQQSRLDCMFELANLLTGSDLKTWTANQASDFIDECQVQGFWPLILDFAGRMSLELSGDLTNDLSDRDLHVVAWAAMQMGNIWLAKSLIRQGLLSKPQSSELLMLNKDLAKWADFCRQFSVGLDYPENDQGLYLQLLGHHHLDSFMAIYDEQVAERCCLPYFMDAADWHQWLSDQYSLGDQLTFAVMHQDYGMIGSVSLVLHDTCGFFYYWIGPDFRGHSFGPEAVHILLSASSHYWGLDTCYAKVFEDNQSSRSGLKKLGFKELPIRAAAPFDSELFYCLGDTCDLDRVTEHMYRFYQKMNCWKPFTRPLIANASHREAGRG